VLVDGEGRLKVTDFGIARAGVSQMTEAGSIIGTAQYLSPEQAKGAPVDQTSDLYSVGVVLYELLTGVVPFSGDTPVEIAMKHLSTVPEAPSTKRAAEALDGFGEGRALVLLSRDSDDVCAKSFRNLRGVEVLLADAAGVTDVVGASRLVVSEGAIDRLVAMARAPERGAGAKEVAA